MSRIIWILAFSAALAASQAAISHPESAAAIAKQQVTECMNKRMAANKTMSYNEAMRLCKVKQAPSKEALASNSPSEAGGKPR